MGFLNIKKSDLLLLSVPPIELRSPPIGIAQLKAVVEQNTNKTVFCVDLNLALYERVKDDYPDFAMECENGGNSIIFRFDKEYAKFYEETYSKILDSWAEEISASGIKMIGLSAFSDSSLYTIRDLCKRLKKIDSTISLIIGGNSVSKITRFLFYPADYYVMGDGEQAIIDIVNGEGERFCQLPSERTPITNLSENAFPDYSDFDFSKYNSLYLVGSKGCVRDCTFCDIRTILGKFRARSSDSIIQEMLYQAKRHDPKIFHFADSLINGSMKYFSELIRTLADLKEQGRFTSQWDAHYIIRGEKIMKPEYFELLAKSNCHMLKIGAETGSDSVLEHMKKEFAREDLDYTMEQTSKHNIWVLFLIIVGYPTETEEDFQQTIEMFEHYKGYNNIIAACNMMYILEDTPIEKWAKENEVGYDQHGNWFYKDNNFVERYRRQNVLIDEMERMGFNLATNKKPKMDKIRLLYENQ